MAEIATLAKDIGIPVDLLTTNRPATNEEKEHIRTSMKPYTSRLASNDKERLELKMEEQRLEDELKVIKEKYLQDLKTIKEKYQKNLKVIKDQQENIERDLQRLKDEEEVLKREYTVQNRVFSPVRVVNDDVLREICLACVNGKTYSSISHRLPPLSLAGVCRRFRNIVLATPLLWSAVHFDEGKYALASEWLTRAGQVPLSISLRTRGPYGMFKPGQMAARLSQLQQSLRFILSFSNRLQKLHFNFCGTDGLLTLFASLTPKDLPILQSLSIAFASDEEITQFSQSQLLQTLPALQHLSLHDVGENIVNIPVKWDRLSSLKLMVYDGLNGHYAPSRSSRLSVSAIAFVIKRTTNLTHLTIYPADIHAENLTGQLILLPHLKTLTIKTPQKNKDSQQVLIDHIDAPLLEELSFDNTLPIPSLITFLKRSPSIRYLSMQNNNFKAAEVTKALSFCPLLTTLRSTLHEDDFSDEMGIGDEQACNAFLEAFVHEDTSQRICPHLERALFEDILFDVSVDVLRRFLQRKQGTTPGLSHWKEVSIFVYVKDHDDEVTKEEISQLYHEQARLEFRLSLRYSSYRPKY